MGYKQITGLTGMVGKLTAADPPELILNLTYSFPSDGVTGVRERIRG